jgi:hypothetical protein
MDEIGLVLTAAAIFWPHNRIKVSRAQHISSTTEKGEAKASFIAKPKGRPFDMEARQGHHRQVV